MAQKLGLALVALFGLVQCEISVLRSVPYGLINLAPAGSHRHQVDSGDEEEGHGPRLGGSDPHLGLSIVNFSKKKNDVDLYDSFGQIVRPNHSSTVHEHQSQDDQHPVRVVVSQAVRTVSLNRVESDSHHYESHSEDHSEDHHNEHPPKKVAVPIFTNLNYVATDDHGSATKAPITVVTAPLVSTAPTDRHKVPINQVLGKSNCPECIEEDREAARTKKAADKALQRDDNLLKTKIEAPIKNVNVPIGEHHSSASRGGERRSGLHKRGNGHSESNSDSKTECDSSEGKTHEEHSHHEDDSHQPKYSGKNLDQKAVYRALALGQARENAPFVVSSVVIPPQGHLKVEHDSDDHSGRRHN